MAEEEEPVSRDYNPYVVLERQYEYPGQWFDDIGSAMLRLGPRSAAMAVDSASALNRDELDEITGSPQASSIPFYDD